MSNGPESADEILVESVLDGDVNAFGVLVERYRIEFRRYAVSLCGDGDLAADAIQESFVRAFKNLRACREPARFKAWFFRILTNQCHNLRKRRRQYVSIETVERAADEGADDRLNRGELRRAIDRALDALKPDLREAFIMRHIEGREYAEMASLFDTSEAALRMRVHRARDELRNLLDGLL